MSSAPLPGAGQPAFRLGYRHYVLALLVVSYVINVVDRTIMGILIEPIRREFALSDTELGLLGGIAFALFYATLGIPIASLADRTSRSRVLAAALIVWSAMTALCGLAVNYATLLLARIGTATGEAGGSPPSHSLIADYFPPAERGTALSIYALGVPLGVALGSLAGGWGNDLLGWRMTFVVCGLPGLLLGLLVLATVREPVRRGGAIPGAGVTAAPPIREVLRFLWHKRSFRHLSLAAALHAAVWYGGSTWNAAFFIRSHGMTPGQAGSWLALFAGVAAIGTLLGGVLSDRLSTRLGDRRWYMWVPGLATLIMVPFQFAAYLSPSLSVVVPSFGVMVVLASVFFGPSFAVTQSLVTMRMRAVAASVLLFVQTLIGLGLGPFVTGVMSDALRASFGEQSLRYALVLVGLANIWAALHYWLGSRYIRADFAATEAMNEGR